VERRRMGISGIEAIAIRDRAHHPDHLRQARWATTGFFLLLGAVLGSWVARIPAVQNALRLDDAQLGVALLSTSVGAIIAMPMTGWLVREWGNPRVMRVAATILCASLPLLPLAPSLPLLMLALFIFGTAFGLLDVSMNVQAVAVEESYRRPIMSTFHGVFSIGGLVGAGSAGLIAGAGVAPVPHLLAVALILLVLVAAASGPLLDIRSAGAGVPVFAIPPRALLGIGVLSFCVLFGEGAVADWSAVYLENVLGSTPAIAAMGYAASALAMAGMRFAGDALTLHFGAERLVRVGGLVAGLGMTGALLIGTIPAAVIGFAAVGGGLAVAFPIAIGAGGRTPGLASGTAIGAVATAGYSGLLVGAPLIGFVSDYAGLRVALGLVAILCFVTALLAGTVRPQR
ncbi:MAG TPA: MFS transporter, partial [Thermomicrobiales bacterium]|nr:MFS transporter [Thermomicrobiales bacterium]